MFLKDLWNFGFVRDIYLHIFVRRQTDISASNMKKKRQNEIGIFYWLSRVIINLLAFL